MVSVKKLSMVIVGMIIVTVFSVCFSVKGVANSNLIPQTNSQVYGKFGEYIVLPEEKAARPRYSLAGLEFTFLATGAETGGKFTIYEFTTPAGKGLPLHYHTRQDEGFLTLEGNATVQTGGVVNPAPPRTFGYLPKNGIHNYLNAGNTQSRTLGSVFPGTIEPYFKEAGKSLTDKNAPEPPSNYEVQKQIAKKHNIIFVEPSKASMPTPLQKHQHVIVQPQDKADRPKYSREGAEFTVLARKEETANVFTQLEITAKPGSKFPLQLDTKGNVAFYVEDGELTIKDNGVTTVMPARSFGYFPSNAIYESANLGTTPVSLIAFVVTTT